MAASVVHEGGVSGGQGRSGSSCIRATGTRAMWQVSRLIVCALCTLFVIILVMSCIVCFIAQLPTLLLLLLPTPMLPCCPPAVTHCLVMLCAAWRVLAAALVQRTSSSSQTRHTLGRSCRQTLTNTQRAYCGGTQTEQHGSMLTLNIMHEPCCTGLSVTCKLLLCHKSPYAARLMHNTSCGLTCHIACRAAQCCHPG